MSAIFNKVNIQIEPDRCSPAYVDFKVEVVTGDGVCHTWIERVFSDDFKSRFRATIDKIVISFEQKFSGYGTPPDEKKVG